MKLEARLPFSRSPPIATRCPNALSILCGLCNVQRAAGNDPASLWHNRCAGRHSILGRHGEGATHRRHTGSAAAHHFLSFISEQRLAVDGRLDRHLVRAALAPLGAVDVWSLISLFAMSCAPAPS